MKSLQPQCSRKRRNSKGNSTDILYQSKTRSQAYTRIYKESKETTTYLKDGIALHRLTEIYHIVDLYSTKFKKALSCSLIVIIRTLNISSNLYF